MKKLITLLFAAVVAVGLFFLLPEKADAATYSGSCGDNVNWSLDTETGVLSITGSGAMADYYSSSGVPWYSYRFSIKTVTIGNSVTSIGDSAFSYCTGLSSITIPESVVSIGGSAFSGCTGLQKVNITDLVKWCAISFTGSTSNPLYQAHNLYLNNQLVQDLVIPDSVTSIGIYAFQSCTGLTSITIPDSVTSIGGSAFSGCTGLTSVTIGDSVTSIGSSAFNNCTGLTEVHITDVARWAGINFSATTANPLYYAHSLYVNDSLITNLEIPGDVKTVNAYAFYGCTSLISVSLSEGVENIGSFAFFNCCKRQKEIVIPTSVKSIERSAFYNWTALKTIYYSGTEDEWYDIEIEENGNNALLNANVIFGKAVSDVVLLSFPEKEEYKLGEALDLTGLSFEVTFYDGTTEIRTDGFTVSGFDSTTGGRKAVNITCEGVRFIYSVKVIVDPDADLIVSGRTLTFDSAFTARYLLNKRLFDAYLAVGMTVQSFTVTVNGKTQNVASAIGSDQIFSENGIDYYWVKVEGIAAKDADTEFTFSLVCKYNGETFTDTYTDSVKAALTQAAAEGGAFANAANATLAYCKAAAEAFGEQSDLTFTPVADVTSYAPITNYTTGSGAIELCGTSILLKEELAIKFWAKKGSFTGSLDSLTVKINGVAVAAEKAENGAYLTFKISVPVSEAKTAMTVELFQGSASVSNRYTDSVLNYALSMTGDSAPLGQAIVNYIHYSNAYLATLAA